jgi:hypothetical protein
MNEKVRKKFERLGRYEKIRQTYFQDRSPERTREMLELCRDVDYLMSEIKRLERRIRNSGLSSWQLEILNMRLRYWEDREKYDTDVECIRAISQEFNRCEGSVRISIFGRGVESEWWLQETAGGKEDDDTSFMEDWEKAVTCPLCKQLMTKGAKFRR